MTRLGITGILVLILLGNTAVLNDAFEFRHFWLSVMQWEDQRDAHANGIDREAELTHGNSGPTDTDGKPTLGENDLGAIPERDDRTQVGGKTKILNFGDATIDKKGGAPINKNGGASINKNGGAQIYKNGDAPFDKKGDATIDKNGDATIDKNDDAPIDKKGDALIDKSGDATIDNNGDATIDKNGDAPIDKKGDAPIDKSGDATIDKNGDATIDKNDDAPIDKKGDAPIDKNGDATIDKNGDATIDKNGDATIDKNRFDEIPEDGGEISGKFIPDREYREHHAPSMKRVGKDGVPLEKEIFDAQGNPKIDAIENTLGTDRVGKDAHEKNCRTELVERPDAKMIDSDNTPENKQRHDFSQENETLPEKTRKIIVIPVCDKSEAPAQELPKVNGDKKEKALPVQHESQRSNYPIGSIYQSNDQESEERYRPEGQVVDKNERQKLEKPQTLKNQDRETGSLSEPSSLQSGQKQNGINSVSAHKNTQLNIDQNEAKEPLTLLDTNKNYGLQEYIENKETNINTNVYVDHKL